MRLMKSTLVLIGGGEIGRGETFPIDKKIVSLVRRGNPHVLFIGAASDDVPSYLEAVRRMYSSFWAETLPFDLAENRPDKEEMMSAISWADVIYLGGGDTRKLIKALDESGFSSLLIKAMDVREDLVVAGLSAGASYWFKESYADCDIMEGKSDKMVFLPCSGYLPFIFTPHAEQADRKGFDKELKDREFGEAYAISGNAALIITSKGNVAFKGSPTSFVNHYSKIGHSITKKSL